MTTPIDKVRAALEHAEEFARNEYSRHIYKEALRELSGMVLVPVEPTDVMIMAGWEQHREDFHCNGRFDSAKHYLAMIAPYVRGE